MYMALTEEHAVQIRKSGLSVIEYKYCMLKKINRTAYLRQKAVRIATKAFSRLAEMLSEFVDSVKFKIEEFCDSCSFPVTRRYKAVKFLSKLGYDKRRMWVATQHTWLARSNC